ncbi:MAG: B-box zinc finger protein [Acidobacteriota bacterium]|nr:B-box zinc finger protein [Acidobacteriota bacterium]
MNCTTHPDIPASAYCRACGKALCQSCQRMAEGVIYCQDHVPVAAGAPAAAAASPYASPYTAPVAAPPPLRTAADTSASPGLAFLLGLIPGVGAIYNGQYVKGLIHVVILGILIAIVSSPDTTGGLEPLFGMLIGVWVLYMAFEAYHTAKKRQMGQHTDEFSSIVPMRRQGTSAFPAGPLFLMALGLLFLLHNLDIIRFRVILHYWPVALIALGAYMLYERITPQRPSIPPPAQEVRHESR